MTTASNVPPTSDAHGGAASDGVWSGVASQAARWLILTIALLAPSFFNNGAFLFPDTASYLKGGAFAVSYAQERFLGEEETPAAELPSNPEDAVDAATVGAASGTSETVAEEGVENKPAVSGARSVAYSILTYILQGPGDTLYGLIAMQAGVIAVLLLFLFSYAGLTKTWGPFLAATAFTVLGTGAGWYADYAMPDVFAGAGVLGMALLALRRFSASRLETLFTIGVVAFAFTSHASHAPLLVGAAGLGVAALFLFERLRGVALLKAFALLFAPIALGAGLTVATNAVAFGEATVIAKRYPFALARSIEDGPARAHLYENCHVYQYAVCELYDVFPETVNLFLWGPEGVRATATAEQMDRIRAEETVILKRAMQAYPWKTAQLTVQHTIDQMLLIGLSNHRFSLAVIDEADGGKKVVAAGEARRPVLNRIEFVHYLAGGLALLSAFILVFAGRLVLSRAEIAGLMIIVGGLFGNAFICGAISGVTDRYQGRIFWILPVFLIAFIGREAMRRRAARGLTGNEKP